MSLKPDLFEGMRFDFNKGLNQKFSLTHSIFMGSVEVHAFAALEKPPLSGLVQDSRAASGALIRAMPAC